MEVVERDEGGDRLETRSRHRGRRLVDGRPASGDGRERGRRPEPVARGRRRRVGHDGVDEGVAVGVVEAAPGEVGRER